MKDSLARRKFLRTAAGAATLAALGPACFITQRDPGEALHLMGRLKSEGGGPGPIAPTRLYPEMPRATVAVRGIGDSVFAAVQEAVAAAGGLGEIESGQTVMIKPNMCGPAFNGRYPKGPITTHPEILRAIIRLCKERGAKVMVGDRAMFDTELAMKSAGFAKVCQEEGAMAFPWTRSDYVRFKPGKRHWSQGFRIPKILTQVDHLINAPILKHHGLAELTCCMKAYVGVCLPLDRHQEGPDALHTNNIGEKIAELNLSVKPTINIVDADEILLSGGPAGTDQTAVWAKSRLIIASKDRVACDSVALAALKRYAEDAKLDMSYQKKSVFDQVQIYYAAELGLGQADPQKITIEDLKAPRMDEIKANWKM